MIPLAPMAHRPRLRAQRLNGLGDVLKVAGLVLLVTLLPIALGALMAYGWST